MKGEGQRRGGGGGDQGEVHSAVAGARRASTSTVGGGGVPSPWTGRRYGRVEGHGPRPSDDPQRRRELQEGVEPDKRLRRAGAGRRSLEQTQPGLH